jgi:hypothetical protein
VSDPVSRLVEAIERRDPDAIGADYEPGARLVTMTPNTFLLAEGTDAIVARLADWFISWEKEPAFSYIATVRDGHRVAVEFERTSTYHGEPWVVREAHMLQVGDGGIRGHRISCCGPRQGTPDLAGVLAGSAS